MGSTARSRRRSRTSGVGVTAGLSAAILLTGCVGASPAATSLPSSTASSASSSTPSSTPSSSASAAVTERPAAPEGELPGGTQTALRATVEQTMADYGVPGAAVGVWVPGKGTWTSAAGTADIEHGIAVEPGMQWPLRSITKSYTVTLVLHLADQGVISLDDTIDEYVEGVTDGDRITLRDLAGMTSGNADYTNEDFVEAFAEDPERIFTLEDLNGFMLGKPAQFAPGTAKVYTNANTNLLGAVVEQVTGQPFDAVLQERILEPLGQADTQYIVDASAWDTAHPVGYAPTEDGPDPQDANMSVFGPAGSMVSTLDDGRVWAETLATGALLDASPQAERLVGAPLDAGPPYDLYALGIGETGGWWGHNGEGFGFTAALFHQPDTGASIVVFMNLSNEASGAHPADQLFRRLAAVIESGAKP
ncbi:serine hydrolase domain-containing protein [Arthrobacter sp. Soc17.1.1.1]|uniref:serine hydrolase domain-containing protein n=1 Tax=Arthrobacter sp. Soc17.1.1.1 TaxID=3121277 RepID=UPI002FE44866